jgi:hypothetical protein
VLPTLCHSTHKQNVWRFARGPPDTIRSGQAQHFIIVLAGPPRLPLVRRALWGSAWQPPRVRLVITRVVFDRHPASASLFRRKVSSHPNYELLQHPVITDLLKV